VIVTGRQISERERQNKKEQTYAIINFQEKV